MNNRGADSELFEQMTRELLSKGLRVRFLARGASMSPAIRDQEVVEVTPVMVTELRKDDIVLAKSNYGFQLHRIVHADPDRDEFITRGDCGQQDDPTLKAAQILGRARSKEVRVGRRIVRANFRGVSGWALRCAARAQYLAQKCLRRGPAVAAGAKLTALIVLGLLSGISSPLQAQVAVDSTTTNSANLTGAGSPTLTIAHTTAGTNRLMLVGVSINIRNSNTTTVTGVTYGATALTLAGAHNDAGLTRRVEIWYLLAPATGTATVTVTVNIPTAQTEGVSAGVTTFTGVDQTSPLGTFTSADGTGIAYSQLNISSVVNGMVLDTLAIGGSRTVAVPGPQVQQWNNNTGGNGGTDVTATGSTRSGAPSIPNSETFSGNSNWSLGAISINPSTADIAVSTSVSAVPLGQNSTYTISVTNNGPSPANNVVLTDTLAASGLTLVSVTPSAGSCSGTGPITCTLPTPLASGTTVTVAVVVTASAAGFYPNTATIADSGTPPDPDTGNNTYVALAPVVSVVCGANTLTGGVTLSNVINTYFPGTASVLKGATTIPVGTSTGAGGTIANGSLLLVIQMQDASINVANNGTYGNGSTGTGFTTINNAGNYEFVTATGAVSGGSVPIKGAGAGSGLVFGYNAAVASATAGQSTYQVVLVPQYISATLSATTPPTAFAWNGSTGGVLALDVAGQLNLNGATVSVNGMGFRGGAGMQLTGGVAGATNVDYIQKAPAAYTGAVGGVAGIDAAKGEGVAGTPEWVESGTSFLQTTSNYPSGTAGVDGSMARGAPGNAGAGGTDSDAAGNSQNAGGGGGGNGGMGGFGGDSWNTNLSSGGEGGSPFPATIDRVAMGGGGGAGSRNNSDGDNQASSGATGGGIIFIRADSFTGTGTFTANGNGAYNGTAYDAGGGGGSGGSIVILAANGGESGLTLQANGGRGGDAWDSDAFKLADRHGPGGGGAGGVIFVSGAPASLSVTGGANGTTLTPGVAYGATSGGNGVTATNNTLGQVTGIQSSALCAPDMTLSKSHAGSLIRGSAATYTIPVSNVSPYGASSGLVTINDTLPFGITPLTASGTGWVCSVSGQTVSCTRTDSLAALSAYPSIAVTATVSQSAPATLTNIATVSGGGESNLLNDTATDVGGVGSIADVAVTDSGSPNPVAAGNNITYTQSIINNGPSAADNATFIAPIPANTTFQSFAAPAGWSCSLPPVGGAGTVVCTYVNLPALASASFTLVVGVKGTVAGGTVITDTVSGASSASDPNSANNTATVNTTVGSTGPNLTVTDVAAPNPVQAGNNITYTQVVTNTGSSAATGATFTENTPANTTFVSITPPAGWTCTGFPTPPTCTNPSVAANSSGTFTVIYKVNGGVANGTVITDTVTANATNQSYGASTATATDIVGAAAQADLALSTVATPSTVLAGNDITYTQTITNNGPGAASNASFTENTPVNTTFASVSAPAGWVCTTPLVGNSGAVNCTATSMASGSTADIVVVLNVPATVAAGTITAASSVTSSTSDPNSANNSTSVSTTVAVDCDLAVTNVGTPSPVAAGGNITYTQVITNTGVSNCSTGTFNEATPANTAFVSVAVANGSGVTWTCPNVAPVACTSPTVAPGTTATVTAIYKVNTPLAAGTIITDTDTVATTSHDTNAGNNSATSTIAVAGGGQADLSVTNVASTNPVTAGNNLTYTQTVTNGGPGAATTPKLVETLPAGTTAVSLTGPAGWACIFVTLTCTDGANLAANTTTTAFTFVVSVPPTATTALTQTDTVSSTTGDPNSSNNSVTVTTQVATSADLAITNTANPVPVLAGNNITYTQVITNNGPSAATTVSMTETTPANTTFQSVTPPAGWTCTTPAVNGTGAITCTDPSFSPGSASFSLVLKVNAGTAAGTAINDTASVSSAVTDPNTANNSATAADVVATAGQSDLVVTNSASPSSVAAGSNVTYTQSVTNLGPAVTTAGMTFTQTTPPNMTFQSISAPAGWTCVSPSVGGTGTITCTDTGSLGVGAGSAANFSLVLQVVSSTPSGTNITDTATATASNVVPSITSNTASAKVLVANANSADVAIVKTASPNPVTQGTPLTYTLTVTNNGPASATNVTVADTLPSVLTYLSSTTTQGTCTEAGGSVTCQLGTMANASTATVTILTIPGAPGVVSNTATVTADQTDPNTANNTSTQTETITAPTRISLQAFSAHLGRDKNGASRVVLTWKTGSEAHNLGFNVYREQSGGRVRVNPSIIAGSALLMSGALPRHSGRSYAWIDTSIVNGVAYWLEDIDVNGTRAMHGPIAVDAGQPATDGPVSETRMLSQLNQAQPPLSRNQESHVVEDLSEVWATTTSQVQKQFELAAHPAVKIQIEHEGWYRVAQPDLVRAGLDPNVDPASLHLFAEAIEHPMQITGATPGPGGFGPQAAINFYGTGIDTLYSGTRVYWLVNGVGPGARIPVKRPAAGSNPAPLSFLSTVELKQRTIYFAALLTPDGDNFFGALVSPTPVDQVLQLPHLDTATTQPAHLELVLQGVITAFPHDVTITLNGTSLGDLTFVGRAKGVFRASLPPGILKEGSNAVTLTAQNGDYDTSLVQSIRITYPHLYVADADQLKFNGRPGDELKVDGFTSLPTVLDITDPTHPVQLAPRVTSNNGNYAVEMQVPWTTTNASAPAVHTLFAVASSGLASAAGLVPNHPSYWHGVQPGAEIAMVTYDDFGTSLLPLVKSHRAEGKRSLVIPVSDLYDEFNFGERSPYAIRQFLQSARASWKTPPSYLLLNGRASLDPRNYLGFGELDLVPTKMVPTPSLETASDDWFSDFNDTGMPAIATGRLPVGTADEANTVVGKIVAYESSSTNGSWTSQALMVADKNDTDNFSQDSQTVQAQLPSSLQVTQVFLSTVGTTAARADIVTAINSGQLLVNYLGHGSEEQWSGSNIFDTNAVTTLTNGNQLPVFLIMNCLNGFFQDVYAQPLGTALLLAPNGGASAVLASTGLNQPPPQVNLDSLVVEGVLGKKETLGEAIRKAKSHVGDVAVRKTYVLFGDPAMKVKQPAASH